MRRMYLIREYGEKNAGIQELGYKFHTNTHEIEIEI